MAEAEGSAYGAPGERAAGEGPLGAGPSSGGGPTGESVASAGAGANACVDAAITGVETLLADVFAGVGVLRERTAALLRRASAEGRRPTSADLATLRPTVLRHLAESRGTLAGTGVIAAPGALADRARWLEWWRVPDGTAAGTGEGTPCPLCVDLDPGSVGAYEYPAADWFDGPRRTGRRTVVGPYVDYAGTDEYILTCAAPVGFGQDFFGVAAADIRATDFERAVLPLLEAEGGAALLVNASGRVLASNTPDSITGSLAPADARRGAVLPRGDGWADCTGLPWSLVRL
ncbi:cache domain-containing protein [Streptomyces daliensis]|uniref:PDC sensor domain-containing protein n=1 Tax=Streptomyces daliensis TaxID=299421 RepID=A0A8T4IV29_9ACTN|nr:PDC sensor domain-containing protein [Streptomyces daliensis]